MVANQQFGINLVGCTIRIFTVLLFFQPSKQLPGGFKYFLFLSLNGEMIQFDDHIFQLG